MWKLVLIASLASCMVGASPLEPDEAELGQTAAPAPSLNWPVIRSGDSNRSVVTAQYLLRDAGLQVPVDGAFRSTSVAAARSFQSTHDIPAGGGIARDRAAVTAVQDLVSSGARRDGRRHPY